MKKIVILLILLLITSLIGYAFWARGLDNHDVNIEDDLWMVDSWREQREISFIDINSGQNLRTENLIWQQTIPSFIDLGRWLWFTSPEMTTIFSYQQMPNNNLRVYGHQLVGGTKSMGTSHGAVLDYQGQLWVWGNNTNGRTGLNLTSGQTLRPTLVATEVRFVQISAGNDYTLAIDTEGQIWSWGNNANGRTGHGISTGNTVIPTMIDTGDTRFKYVSGTGTNNNTQSHSLAIDTKGQIWSWGSNQFGQTGLGITTGATLRPTLVYVEDTQFKSVRAANQHSLAIDIAGNLWSWGNNDGGRAGLGVNTIPALEPTMIDTDGVRFLSIATSNDHSLAIDNQGRIWSWGLNQHGRTGLGETVGATVNPTTIETGSARFVSISTNNAGSAAVDSQGRIWTWGDNEAGRNGNGLATGTVNIPTVINTGTNRFSQIFSNSNGTAAIDSNGRLWNWGSHNHARSGLGLTSGQAATPQLNPIIIPFQS